MKPIIKKFTAFINENEDEDRRELARLGLEPVSWEVELEIDWGQAAQNTPDGIKNILVNYLTDINMMPDEYYLVPETIDIDEWTEEDYVMDSDEDEDDEDGDMPNYDQRNFIKFVLKTRTSNAEIVSAWIEEMIIGDGRVFTSIENIEEV
jgi:hypothetical protein